MKNIYVLVMDGVYRICIWLSGISLLFMTFIYLVGIYARFRPDFPAWLDFLPHASTSWPEPLSQICMITFSFVGRPRPIGPAATSRLPCWWITLTRR